MIRKLGIVLAVIISMYIGVEQCHSQSISSTLSDMIHQAEDGDEAAMWSLAIYSYTGEFAHEGIPKNIIQSIYWCDQLIKRPNSNYVISACILKAEMYETGKGVKKDINKAIALWERAAEQRYATAIEKLAEYKPKSQPKPVSKPQSKPEPRPQPQPESQPQPQQEYMSVTVKGISFKMVAVDGGSFMMGANKDDSEADSNEKPRHGVVVSDFYIGATEVTQELWYAVMKNNPSYFKGKKNPVENVSWDDCQKFIAELNRLTGKKFRLPTEAEWEYAARGGKLSRNYKYSGSNNINDVAWYNDNSSKRTQPVGLKLPNELGIYDMSGNVWEWCSDWYDSGYYSKTQLKNPMGATSGTKRVDRGGSWNGNERFCRISFRYGNAPEECYGVCGLRLVMSR